MNVGLERSLNSVLWSIPKHKWLDGPSIENTGYQFIHACAVAINVSSVLFIGLSKFKKEPEPENHFNHTYHCGSYASDYGYGYDYGYGCKNSPTQLHLDASTWRTANNITAIYNFELHKWEQQDYLNLYNSKTDYSYELTCTIMHEKDKNR